ncbi:endonuclease/exonuclease/phosphatase family protein [uncultured Olsenella sp.]|uniref:endonuclease/exonuclease/phosphatase family protein n=1 Tax=uncultured Olsenella sp. TaxID=190764 RepID=UPI0026DA8012|nr:endonuclease/exonuclease/phosphatase family protein [uncultured Olsenella sp.]
MRRGRGGRHNFLSFLLWMLMLPLLGLLVLRMLPLSHAQGRAVPELTSFVIWTLPAFAFALALSLLWRRRNLAALSLAAAALVVVWHLGYFLPTQTVSEAAVEATSPSDVDAPVADDDYLRLMTFNTRNGRADAAALVRAVRERRVEVLALQEVSWTFLDELGEAGIHELLPHYVLGEASATDNGGINAIFSLQPLSRTSSNLMPTESSALAAGTVTLGERRLRFVSTHPNSPHLGGQGLWSEGLASVSELAGYDNAYVIMGDFNATWDHVGFRKLLGDSFLDAGEAAGEGLHLSFPANSVIPPLIEIDHIVYSKGAGIAVGQLETLQIAGSDHLALLATLEAS